MVVISSPAAAETGIKHDRVGRPSRCTVHAPQSPMPHPNLVPFNFNESRITHSNGVVGSKSDRSRSVPLIDIFIVAIHPDFLQTRSLSRSGSPHAYTGRARLDRYALGEIPGCGGSDSL